MLKKELRGRKIKMTRSMDAEESFHQKRMGHVKYCIHTRHNIPLNSISLNCTSKYVSVKGQIVVKTCQSGSLKYIKYQDIEPEVEDQMEKWQSKKLIATTVSSRETGQRRRNEGKTTSSQYIRQHKEIKEMTDTRVKEAAGKSSNKLTETFQHA